MRDSSLTYALHSQSLLSMDTTACASLRAFTVASSVQCTCAGRLCGLIHQHGQAGSESGGSQCARPPAVLSGTEDQGAGAGPDGKLALLFQGLRVVRCDACGPDLSEPEFCLQFCPTAIHSSRGMRAGAGVMAMHLGPHPRPQGYNTFDSLLALSGWAQCFYVGRVVSRSPGAPACWVSSPACSHTGQHTAASVLYIVLSLRLHSTLFLAFCLCVLQNAAGAANSKGKCAPEQCHISFY